MDDSARLRRYLTGAIVLAFALYLLYVFFVQTAPFELTPSERLELERRGAVVVGFEERNPPFSFRSNGNITGIYVEMLRAMGRILDVEMRFRSVSPPHLWEAVSRGEIDVAVGPAPTGEAKTAVAAASEELFSIPLTVFVRSSDREISTLEDLRGKTIGVIKGSECESFFRRRSGYLLQAARSRDELLDMVFSGETAAIAGKRQVIRYFLRRCGKETGLRSLPPLSVSPRFVLTRHKDAVLRSILGRLSAYLRTTGLAEEIETAFTGPPSGFPFSKYRDLFYAALAAMALLVLVSLLASGRVAAERHRRHSDRRGVTVSVTEGAPLTRLSVREVLDSLLGNLKLSGIALRTAGGGPNQTYFVPENLAERSTVVPKALETATERHFIPVPDNPIWYAARLPRGGRIVIRTRGLLQPDELDAAYLYAAVAEATALAVEAASDLRSTREILQSALETKGEAFLVLREDFTVEEVFGTITGLGGTELQAGNFLKLLDKKSYDEFRKNIVNSLNRQEFTLRGKLVLHGSKGAVPCSYILLFKILARGERLLLHLLDERVKERALDIVRRAYRAESLAVQALSFVATFERFFLSIQGYANLLSERSSETDKPRIRRILEFARRGVRLSELLVMLAEPTRKPAYQTLELSTFVDDYLKPLELVFPDYRVEVVPLDRNYYFDGVPDLLFTAAFAIVSNAVEASPKGGEVKLSFRGEEVEGGRIVATGMLPEGFYVVMEVEDSGTGIKASEKKRIFEPFFTTKGKDRRGLGLTAALSVARSLGGGIDVSSEAGTGTRVSFYLPARERAVATDEKLQGRGENILIINPSQEWLDILVNLFNRFGYASSGVSNRGDALRLLHLQAFHCVLINAEERRGETVVIIEEIRRTRPAIPIVVLADPAEAPYFSRLLRDDSVRVIPRTGDVKEIIRGVRDAAARPRGS